MDTFYQNAAVLYSESTRRLYVDQAKAGDGVYRFKGARGFVEWIRGERAYLAVGGLSAILRRLGVKFDLILESNVRAGVLRNYELLFVPDAQFLPADVARVIASWTKGGGKLVVSGRTTVDADTLGIEICAAARNDLFAGVVRKNGGRSAADGEPLVLSCPGYTVCSVRASGKSRSLGKLEYFDAQGKDSPGCANEKGLDAVVATGATLYFAPPLFEYIGALLQGHAIFEDVRAFAGRDADYYIDTLAAYVKAMLDAGGLSNVFCVRHKPWGSYDHVLILHHDTDSSRDTTYLDYESSARLAATYAVLADGNCAFWKRRLEGENGIETAFHYTSTREGLLRRILSPDKAMPSKGSIAGRGVYRQIESVRSRRGLDFSTIHRHGHFFYYPETIDALDYAYERTPGISGGRTMFRYIAQQYSDGPLARTFEVRHPHTSVPFWFPFKPFFSSIDVHRELPAWDLTQHIEPLEEDIDLCIDMAKRLDGGVYTMGFHPAHAQSDTIKRGGNFSSFLYCIKRAGDEQWWVANYKQVVERLNEWQNIRMRVMQGNVVLRNVSQRRICDIVLNCNGVIRKVPFIEGFGEVLVRI